MPATAMPLGAHGSNVGVDTDRSNSMVSRVDSGTELSAGVWHIEYDVYTNGHRRNLMSRSVDDAER